jgi:hypothetical protein
MMATGRVLIDGYLQRLAAATADLPPEVRDDLLTDVRTHLLEVQLRAASDVEVREALDRLGAPEAIAAEARGGPGAPTASGAAGAPPPSGAGWAAPPPPTSGAGRTAAPSPARTTSSLGYDATALLTLLFGGLLIGLLTGAIGMVLGWTAGVGLVWASRTWSGGEKALATLVWPGGYLLPLLLGLTGSQVCTSTEATDASGAVVFEEVCEGFALPVWLGIPLLVVLVAAPVVVAWLLLRRGDARRAAEHT